MSDFKQSGIISHALHSRLQLIRWKLYCYKGISIDAFIDANREFFTAASASIQKRDQLNISSNIHWREAARMFLSVAGDLEK
jgi:hypothetical protein